MPGLVPGISLRKARCRLIGMAGTKSGHDEKRNNRSIRYICFNHLPIRSTASFISAAEPA